MVGIFPVIICLITLFFFCPRSLQVSMRGDDDPGILSNTFQGGALQGRAKCADHSLGAARAATAASRIRTRRHHLNTRIIVQLPSEITPSSFFEGYLFSLHTIASFFPSSNLQTPHISRDSFAFGPRLKNNQKVFQTVLFHGFDPEKHSKVEPKSSYDA